jgi:hypothetical protein
VSDAHISGCCRFFCTSDLPKYPLGHSGRKEFAVHFFLSDDTLEVREVRAAAAPNAGYMPSAGAKFLRRQKVPRHASLVGELRKHA